jgi:hypothetical protein
LPLQVIRGAAEIGKPDHDRIDRVQLRDRLAHRPENPGAIFGRQSGQQRIEIDPSGHVFHDIERTAQDRVVLAQCEDLRHRHVGCPKRLQDAIFPIHRMRRLQQVADGLATQHVIAGCGLQPECRVGLAALETLRVHRTAISRHVLRQPRIEAGQIGHVRERRRFAQDDPPADHTSRQTDHIVGQSR